MQIAQFVSAYPRLYHMTAPEAWPQIRKHGLGSTSALLGGIDLGPDERAAIESQRRPQSVTLEHPTVGKLVIRDNGPINDAKLGRALTDMQVPEWYRLLNSFVFFWVSPHRIEQLLAAKAYRTRDHLVLTLDTQKLLDRYEPQVRLSPINSGSTLFNPPPRGSQTFRRIEDYPIEEYKARRPRDRVAELAVLSRVEDVSELVIATDLHRAEQP